MVLYIKLILNIKYQIKPLNLKMIKIIKLIDQPIIITKQKGIKP